MDAGLVLSTPQAPPAAADRSPDVSREDAEAFATHLSQEAREKPPARKPVTTDQEEDAPREKDEATAAPLPPSYALTSPTAPVLVREDGSPAVLNIDLTAPNAAPAQQASPNAAALALAATVAANAGGAATPAADTDPDAAAAPAVQGAVPVAPPSDAESPTTQGADATALFNLPGAEAAAAAAPLQAKTTAEHATSTARNTGKARGARDEADDVTGAKPQGASAAATQAAARADLKPEFVAASTTPALTAGADTSAPPVATGEAAAVSLEARRAAEAPPLAVHRPPTVAATVAQHIIRRFDGKSTSIDVRLDPAELGRISVKLEVGPDSRVTAIVAADNPATLSDLIRSSRELERALESAGLDLTQGGLSFSLSDRSNDTNSNADNAGGPRLSAGNDNKSVPDAAAPASRPFGLESWRGVRVDVTV